jgi:glycosyltransferase involved in cell wall biosynthesis
MNMPVFPSRSLMTTARKSSCIVCCTTAQENWQWLPDELDEKPRQWHFCDTTPGHFLERSWQYPNFAAIRASWQAVRLVQRNRADLLVTSHPTLTFWCALLVLLQNVKVDHVALSFNLPRIPCGFNYVVAQWVYASVSRFIVHSRAERQLYSESFGIPPSRFEMQHWSQEAPPIQVDLPIWQGEYICAISDQPQDYRSLMAAMAMLPDIPLILVVPRGRAIRTRIASNVIIQAGLSPRDRLNLLQHSRFLVLPIRNSYRPCDHPAMVTAMQLGKTFVTADLPNVSDYAFHNSNAVLYESANPKSLANTIRDLWQNIIRCEVLGENGREFVATFCSRKSVHHCFVQLLTHRGL